jgi:hypothetical protein
MQRSLDAGAHSREERLQHHAQALAGFDSHELPPTSGADRDRTDDLRLAKPALSQLSYSPEIQTWTTP